MTQGEISRLETLEQNVRDIQETLRNLTARLEGNVLEIEDIPFEKAREMVTACFRGRHGAHIYPDEIMRALKMDIRVACRACGELCEEGRIREAA
jgi:hypothetical protein